MSIRVSFTHSVGVQVSCHMHPKMSQEGHFMNSFEKMEVVGVLSEKYEDEKIPELTEQLATSAYFQTLGRTLKPKNHNMQNKRMPAGSRIKAVEHFPAVSCRSSSSSFEAGFKIILVIRAGTIRSIGHASCVSQQRIPPIELRKILRLTVHFFNTDLLPSGMTNGRLSIPLGLFYVITEYDQLNTARSF